LKIVILTYRINNISKGLLVYADDTNVICESLVNLRKVIVLIENFCSDFDITINVKKTKWMRLTPNYSLEEGHVEILGVILESNGMFIEHYKNRRKLFFGGISEINNFGFFGKELNTRMKLLLYTSLVMRSKLLYGLETVFFKKKDLKKLLSTLEANQIKKAFNLSTRSKSRILLYALRISPIEITILKRKIGFLKQLCNNPATADLIRAGVARTLEDVYVFLDINYDRDIVEGSEIYLDEVRKKCYCRIKEILVAEKKIMNSDIVKSVRYLLNNRNPQNDDSVQYILDPSLSRDEKKSIAQH